jgi:hypothetical protein
MTKAPEDLLAMRVGASRVGDNLRRAREKGRIIEREDGTLALTAKAKEPVYWMYVSHGPSLGCAFLMNFMFRHAYAEASVPHGCSACYKVKVVLRTLRQLAAGWELGKRVNCHSKWGTDLNNPFSQNIYAGYFYVSGLDTARALYKFLRPMIDADPKLGPGVSMTIKRGCSEYEAKLGPSDHYEFTPEMAELETYLKARFRKQTTGHDPSLVAAHWIETAFSIGDDTYLDFTGGQRLRRKTVTYDPM